MQWECHECGHLHQALPEACEKCGTRPEIVVNVWRCAHCGHEGIPATDQRCPSCGVDRGLGVETAVDPGRRIEGDVARKLAQGDWLYCAYCDVQVPPVDEQGQQNEVCPTCQGPLSEASLMAAEEEVDAAQAGEYSKEQTRKVGQAATAPAPEPKKRALWPFVLIGVLLLAVVGVVLYFVLRGPDQLTVAQRRWTCTLPVQVKGPVQGQAWATELPAGAYNRSCSPQVHHYNKVPAGTESYSDKVADGRSCVSYGYKKKGGTSVKTCKRWKTKYKTVQKTRTRYRRVPVMRSKCRYTVDRWKTVRSAKKSGTGKEQPSWPEPPTLAAGERLGPRQGVYTLVLKGEDGQKSYTCKSLAEWKRYPKGSRVLAETSGETVDSIQPAK